MAQHRVRPVEAEVESSQHGVSDGGREGRRQIRGGLAAIATSAAWTSTATLSSVPTDASKKFSTEAVGTLLGSGTPPVLKSNV
jgi:hypothetical protein